MEACSILPEAEAPQVLRGKSKEKPTGNENRPGLRTSAGTPAGISAFFYGCVFSMQDRGKRIYRLLKRFVITAGQSLSRKTHNPEITVFHPEIIVIAGHVSGYTLKPLKIALKRTCIHEMTSQSPGLTDKTPAKHTTTRFLERKNHIGGVYFNLIQKIPFISTFTKM